MTDYAWIQKWREMAQVEVDQTRDQLSAEKCNPWEVHGYYSSREQIRLLNVIEDMKKALGLIAEEDLLKVCDPEMSDKEALCMALKGWQRTVVTAREVLAKYAERPGDEIQ